MKGFCSTSIRRLVPGPTGATRAMVKQTRQPTIVTASDIAQFAYCPEAARLESLGTPRNKAATKRMAAGEHAHAQWQRHEDARADRARGRRIILRVVFALVAAALVAGFGWRWVFGDG